MNRGVWIQTLAIWAVVLGLWCGRFRVEVAAQVDFIVGGEEDLIEGGLPGQDPSQRPSSKAQAPDPLSKPLTLWLNGGPGCSSVGNGAFEELGPFRPRGDGRGLVENPSSWNKAQDALRFLLGWFKKFPKYRSLDFFLTGESYAGHYLPRLASLMLNYNQQIGHVFNLKGIAIGNPLLNLGRHSLASYMTLWSRGAVSDETFNALSKACTFADYNLSPSHNEPEACEKGIAAANVEVGNFINLDNLNLDVCYTGIAEEEIRLHKMVHNVSFGVDVCMDSEIAFYLNLPEVQAALHTAHLNHTWLSCSTQQTLNYSIPNQSLDMTSSLADILKQGVCLWIYSGDLDSIVPLTSTRTIINELAHKMRLTKVDAHRAWYYKGQVGGWTMSYGTLTYATVRGAGHMVPSMQPERSLALFQSFLAGTPLPKNKLKSPN
ncbi:hypothetical protein GOP47_0017533 [Adiantum capillus-veneris]|uniref:Carboxypeptidase n=1 Tax=Adiantum capillus-veneris TaxID=13818 RepID=A0A9D4UFT2_ADICA|nr:hypothetical protein GOP47_0017533 [Adiantum capillus-veneris]